MWLFFLGMAIGGFIGFLSNSNIVDLVYDETSGKYLRYQFNGDKHIDEKQCLLKKPIQSFTN